MPTPMPYAITRRDDGLLIEWTEGGEEVFYPARSLRLACPCAVCVDEMTGRPLIDSASIPAEVKPLSVALVGTYGIRIAWSDGHGTGIYTFERLRTGSGTA
jgi:DUF971 family protein